MNKSLDIFALLLRGGEMSASDMERLTNELTESTLSHINGGFSGRSLDQPIKIVPRAGYVPRFVTGYFTQQKFLWGKTPVGMECLLGMFGKLRQGACVVQFLSPLRLGDYENKAYSYLPVGKQYEPDPKETVCLPGTGVPQWKLTIPFQVECIAILRPGQHFYRKSPKT